MGALDRASECVKECGGHGARFGDLVPQNSRAKSVFRVMVLFSVLERRQLCAYARPPVTLGSSNHRFSYPAFGAKAGHRSSPDASSSSAATHACPAAVILRALSRRWARMHPSRASSACTARPRCAPPQARRSPQTRMCSAHLAAPGAAHTPLRLAAHLQRTSRERAEVGLRVERGRGGRVEGQERERRWGCGQREGGEVGSRV
eukprot:270109-Rhodomonas_salina.1